MEVMKGFTVIPAGYRLTVESWENDGDSRSTEIIEGLTKHKAQYLVDLCKLFEHSTDYKHRLRNLYEPDDEQVKRVYDAIVKVAQRYPFVLAEMELLGEPDEVIGDAVMDDLCNLGLSGSEFFTRVCESYKVEHLPNTIIMQDVTEEFQ